MTQKSLMPYTQRNRDKILCTAIGSPDPDGRQIGGVGGGTSSTSKVAIVSQSKHNMPQRLEVAKLHPFPGLPWLDTDVGRVAEISDIVYRAGQVPINGDEIDWKSTCGNMMAAIALQGALDNANVYGKTYHLGNLVEMSNAMQTQTIAETEAMLQNRSVVVRILAHDTGKVFRAHVPVAPRHIRHGIKREKSTFIWFPRSHGTYTTAGVPGVGAPITLEAPVDGQVLVTGNERDAVEVDGQKIDVSIVDVGLPVVIVSADSLGFPLSDLLEHPTRIDANRPLMEKLERIRQAASALTPHLQSRLSLAAPKLCVVHRPTNYTTTGNLQIMGHDMDVFARTVSSGQLHRTVPATTLSALAASACFPNSIVSQIVAQNGLSVATQAWIESVQPSRHEVAFDGSRIPAEAGQGSHAGDSRVALSIGHPAGVATAGVATSPGLGQGTRRPTSIVMQRSAQRIWTGNIWVPANIGYAEELRSLRNDFRNRKKESQPKMHL